jgi:hypothetical protein
MTEVWLAAKTLYYPQAGGHFWAYLIWALGLRALGCRVVWLEAVSADRPPDEVRAHVAALKSRLSAHGLADVALCAWEGRALPAALAQGCIPLEHAADADLLLNLQYGTHPSVLRRFRRSALIDIDPGQAQIWMSEGQINVAPHDVYFSIGETVGTPQARFPDCGLTWHHTPPPVYLPAWPVIAAGADAPYTTVSNWWGEWMEYRGEVFNNDKRTAFLEFLDLPAHTRARLELALTLAEHDADEARMLTGRGWRVRHARDVSSTPEQYRAYIQQSRGEYSCAKPAYVRYDTGWVSDRTLCYLASGKPAVVQHNGRSRYLPDAHGMLRFRTLAEAARALSTVEAEYDRHCGAARALAEEHFDAEKVIRRVLERALA